MTSYLAGSCTPRPLALALAFLFATSALGELVRPGFDAASWLVDVRALPRPTRLAVELACAVALVLAVAAPGTGWGRAAAFVLVAVAAVAVVDGVAYRQALTSGRLASGLACPLSWLTALGFVWIARGALLPGGGEPRAIAVAVATLAWLAAIPLLHTQFFGRTDYRRPADVAIVLGARVYSDGTPSQALRDRLATACELYRAGVVHTLVMSGGPGDGAIHETEAMRSYATRHGVPAAAIRLDPGGVNTHASVDGTCTLLRDTRGVRVLVVSHGYHLPRVAMAYERSGLRVRCVPARESRVLVKMPWFLAREVAAWWLYYLAPRAHAA